MCRVAQTNVNAGLQAFHELSSWICFAHLLPKFCFPDCAFQLFHGRRALLVPLQYQVVPRLFPKEIFLCCGNKTFFRSFILVYVPEEHVVSASFEELALPLFDRLYNFAHWLTQNREEAEDLVQETFAKALKGFSSFQQGTNFRAWIYRILRNTFLTSRTGLKSTATEPLDLEDNEDILPATTNTPESILLDRLDQQLVRQALDRLPVRYREILLLCEVEEMSYQELSSALAIPIGTVMSRLSRARRALRDTAQTLQRS